MTSRLSIVGKNPRRVKHTIAVILLLIGWVFLAWAQSVPDSRKVTPDGNGLLVACDQRDLEDDAVKVIYGYCMGIVEGVSEQLQLQGKICLPEGVTDKQQIAIVIKFLRNNPRNLDIVPAALIETALRDTFPCKPMPHEK